MLDRARIALRPITAEDSGLLYRIYAATREAELAQVPWDAAQKAAFLTMQFEAQAAQYAENYPGAQFDVILFDGDPAGRLYVHRRAAEIRVVDIALLPAYQGRGIGTCLLRELQAEAQARAVPLTIHVEVFNPARRLYERLGFQPAADRGVYLLMAWTPETEMP
jgi:ribosomal protein S18 acetylase RimI-like enzyme